MMKGFVKILLLLVLLVALGVGFHYVSLDYRPYRMARNIIDLLPEADSSFDYFRTAQYNRTSAYPPLPISTGGLYQSPFPPCVALVEDRNWDIFASRNNLYSGGRSKMLYERFWNIVWLVIDGEEGESRFYGPYQLTDLPERTYLDYIFIGKDVRQEGSNLIVMESKTACMNRGTPGGT